MTLNTTVDDSEGYGFLGKPGWMPKQTGGSVELITLKPSGTSLLTTNVSLRMIPVETKTTRERPSSRWGCLEPTFESPKRSTKVVGTEQAILNHGTAMQEGAGEPAWGHTGLSQDRKSLSRLRGRMCCSCRAGASKQEHIRASCWQCWWQHQPKAA